MNNADNRFRIVNASGITGGVWDRTYPSVAAAQLAIAEGMGWAGAEICDSYECMLGAEVWLACEAGVEMPLPGSRAEAHCPRIIG